MKLRSIAVAVAALALTGNALAQDLSSEKGKLSYYFGYDMGNNLAELTARGEQLDINAIVKGVQDAYAKQKPAITADQLKPAIEAFQKREQTRAQQAKAEYDKAAADNKTKSDQFIARYKGQQGVKLLPNGVAYKVLENGTGAKPTQASTVALEVSGPFPMGQRPQSANPPQNIPSIKVSAVEMAAAADAGRFEVGSGVAAGQGLWRRPAHRLPAERGGGVRDQADLGQVIPRDCACA